MSVQIQTEDFDLGAEYESLRHSSPGAGAIVTFCGLVREFDQSKQLEAMSLEHYPGMTEKALHAIIETAKQRWRIDQAKIIHRVGKLAPRDQIVFVGVTSAHRQDAFEAAQFIMDYLKTQAPFWKKEFHGDGERWVEAKDSDRDAADRW